MISEFKRGEEEELERALSDFQALLWGHSRTTGTVMAILAAEGFGVGLQTFSQGSFQDVSIHLTKVSPDKLFSSVFSIKERLNLLKEAQVWTNIRSVPWRLYGERWSIEAVERQHLELG